MNVQSPQDPAPAPANLPTYDDVVAAAQRIDGVAHRTPVLTSRTADERTGGKLFFKAENFQRGGAFKFRGAYNAIARLSPDAKQRGVVAFSSGNHAQGVALGARELGVDAVIVMPATTPSIKTAAVAALGARIVLHGDSYDEAAAHGRMLATQEGRTLVHPYDDADVIAGQGTVAMELMAQHRGRIDAVFIPVGGGGLCAGMATYLKALDPGIKVIARTDFSKVRPELHERHPEWASRTAEGGIVVDGGRHRLAALELAAGADDVGAGGGEQPGDGLADAAGGAADQGGLAGKVEQGIGHVQLRGMRSVTYGLVCSRA